MARAKDFREDVKLKCLLWSDRHCCVCEKSCGLDIEVHHIDPNGGNDLDNAIPVCYDCHADLGRYVDGQPRGNKYRIEEIKKRREQIYERYTCNLIPGLLPTMHPTFSEKGQIQLPKVVFTIKPIGRFIPVKAEVTVNVYLGGTDLGPIKDIKKPYYNHGILWNLNPGPTFVGNFSVPSRCVTSEENLVLELRLTAIDPYDREHNLLPICFSYVRTDSAGNGWWFMEPTSFSELKRYMKKQKSKS